MKYLLLCLVLLLAPATKATETYVHIGMWSQHLAGRGHKNQTHDLLAIEYNNFLVGSFINSYYHRTYVAVRMHREGICKNGFCLGHYYGFVKGYTFGKYDGVIPVVLPVLSYTGKTWGTDIQCVLTEVCSIQFRFKL